VAVRSGACQKEREKGTNAKRGQIYFFNGFKPRIATYDGFEVPVPLAITVQHGDGDLVQVAKDILGLTKLNYNSCQLGEGQPITVKYSDGGKGDRFIFRTRHTNLTPIWREK
jgi:hypothetical protein